MAPRKDGKYTTARSTDLTAPYSDTRRRAVTLEFWQGSDILPPMRLNETGDVRANTRCLELGNIRSHDTVCLMLVGIK